MTVAFVKVAETDALLERDGPATLQACLDTLAAAVERACTAYEITWLESDIDVGAIKLYLTAGAPFTSGEDEEGMLRAVRDILAADIGLPMRAGVNRGHVFTGDIGAATRRTYAVMGDAVNLAARLTARAQNGDVLTTVDVLDHGRTEYRTEVEPLLVKGKEQAILAQRVLEPTGTRAPAAPGAAGATARPRARARAAVGRPQRRPAQAAPVRRDRRRAGHRQVAPRPGASRARGRVPAARGIRRALRDRGAVRRGPSAAAAPRRHPRDRRACGGRADPGGVRRRRHARPRPDAPAARGAVRRRGAEHGRGGRHGRRPEPRPAARGRRRAPGADAAHADALRRRGRALAGRRLALPAPLSDRGSGASALARVHHHATAPRAGRGGGARRAPRARAPQRRGRGRARAPRCGGGGVVGRDDELARRACGRQPALRPGARVGGAPRRAARRRCPTPSSGC